MSTEVRAGRWVDEPVQLRRSRTPLWHSETLHGEDRIHARIGPGGFFRTYFGRGRTVVLDDGTRWKLTAATVGPHVVPRLANAEGTLAIGRPAGGSRSYGISVRDAGYTLFPTDRHARRWCLRSRDEDVATIDRTTRILTPTEPIPVAVVLLAFNLAEHGIPGELPMVPGRLS